MVKVLTAAEVRALPEGARVVVHGHDRHGYPTRLPCEVVPKLKGKGVELRFTTCDGFMRMPISARKGRTFTVEDSGDGTR